MALQRTITEADMAANPILAELQGVVGDVCSIVHDEVIPAPVPEESVPPLG